MKSYNTRSRTVLYVSRTGLRYGTTTNRMYRKIFGPYEIYTADEAFMTGTPFSILPVFKFNELPIGDGKFGKITKVLIDQWGKNVGVDLIKQIKDFSKECEDIRNKTAGTTNPYQFSSPDTPK